MIDLLVNLGTESVLRDRYNLDPLDMSGEEYLHKLAEVKYKNDRERLARQLLQDFRKGYLGSVSLEYPAIED